MPKPIEKWVIKSIKNTCGAAPTECVGRLKDGRFIVFHYEDGVLLIGVANTEYEAWENADNFEIELFSEMFSELADDWTLVDIPFIALKWLTRFIIDWSQLELKD